MIDCAVWYNGAYVYYPLPGLWNVRVTRGEVINIGYWQIFLSVVLIVVSAFELGRSCVAEKVYKQPWRV
jgi:hypothetical protein